GASRFELFAMATSDQFALGKAEDRPGTQSPRSAGLSRGRKRQRSLAQEAGVIHCTGREAHFAGLANDRTPSPYPLPLTWGEGNEDGASRRLHVVGGEVCCSAGNRRSRQRKRESSTMRRW